MTTITLLSWNVNGARAVHRAGFLPWLAEAAPDILCLQETRCDAEQLPAEMRQPPGYHAFWHGSARKKGYSGTALLTRSAPEAMRFGLGDPQFDDEGRTIVADYPDFTLINCYFPNGGRDHSRVPYKLAFYDAFLALCERLRAEGRPVIFCGDVNTAHREIDLARPRENRNTTGFLPGRARLDGYVWSHTVMSTPSATSTPTWRGSTPGGCNSAARASGTSAGASTISSSRPRCCRAWPAPSSCPRCAAATTARSAFGSRR